MSRKAKLVQQSRFKFLPQAQISYNNPDPAQRVLGLGVGIYLEITAHRIPTDLEAVDLPRSSRSRLDLFMSLTYRCFASRGPAPMPVFGPLSLESQVWPAQYSRNGGFWAKLDQYSGTIRFVRLGRPDEVELALSQSPPGESGRPVVIWRQGLIGESAAGMQMGPEFLAAVGAATSASVCVSVSDRRAMCLRWDSYSV